MSAAICSEPDCGTPIRPGSARGLCIKHYNRLKRSPDFKPMREHHSRGERKCEHPGCGRKHLARGLCAMHVMRKRRGADMDAPGAVRVTTGNPNLERDLMVLAVVWGLSDGEVIARAVAEAVDRIRGSFR